MKFKNSIRKIKKIHLKNTLIARGMVAQKIDKDYTKAIKYFRQALDVDPDDADEHYNLGVLFQKLNRFEEAEAEYRKSIDIYPGREDVHLNLGCILITMGRIEDAEKELRESARINPNNSKVHFNLGNLSVKLNHFEDAEKEYKKAIELDPEHWTAHFFLSKLLMHIKKDNTDALKHFARSYDLIKKELNKKDKDDADRAYLYKCLGVCCTNLGKKDEGKDYLKKSNNIMKQINKIK